MGEKGIGRDFRRAWLKVYGGGFEMDPDGERAFNPETGQNAAWDDEKQRWIDTKTGKPLKASVKWPE